MSLADYLLIQEAIASSAIEGIELSESEKEQLLNVALIKKEQK